MENYSIESFESDEGTILIKLVVFGVFIGIFLSETAALKVAHFLCEQDSIDDEELRVFLKIQKEIEEIQDRAKKSLSQSCN